MPLDKKFLQEVEELIDIAHQASSADSTDSHKKASELSERRHYRKELSRESSVSNGTKKPKSRLTNIQKAIILAEILPRKY